MKFHYKIFFLILFFDIKSFDVRVLLQDSNNPVWNFKSSRGFIFKHPFNKKEFPIDCLYKNINISLGKCKNILINGRKLKSKLVLIEPIDNRFISFNNRIYDGSFLIASDKKNVKLINILPLESYVCSVLKTESWPGWPLELNKAFAITSRTYILYQLLESRRQKKFYDITDTNKHQTYSGVHEDEILKQAVNETNGIYVSYKGRPILAMFDCCCGGVIPAKMQHLKKMTDVPYLIRNYACNHCKSCSLYEWTLHQSLEKFEKLVKEKLNVSVSGVKEILIKEIDKAGLVQKMHIHSHQKTTSFSGKQVYRSLKLKSLCFSAQKKSNHIVFTGKGYGHLMGLCQWGAKQMVSDGKSYKDVLNFYYPGTQCVYL